MYEEIDWVSPDDEIIQERFRDFESEAILKLTEKERRQLIDSRTDTLASMLAEIQDCDIKEMADRMGVSVHYIRSIAHRANIKWHDRRGRHSRRKVELVNLDGYVVGKFESIKQAAEALHVHPETVHRRLCKKRIIISGVIARYAK